MSIRRQLLATITPQAEGAPLIVDITRGAPPTLGVAVSGLSLVASGGVAPYAYTLLSGSLPTGLSLASNGVISGTPSAQGTFVFVVQAQDFASQVSPPRSFSLVVGGGLIVPSRRRPIGVRNIPYSHQLVVTDSTGSTAGITFAVQSGSLPAGLSLSSSGLITGTPSSQGYSWVTVRATKGGAYVDLTFRLQINSAFTLAGITTQITDSLKNMVVGVPVSGYVTVRWPLATMPVGIAPYSWAIASGALPAGLTMDSLGKITGTPTAPTAYNYTQPTFAVTDKTGTTINVTLSGGNQLIVAAAVKQMSPRKFLVTDAGGVPSAIDFLAQIFGDGSDGACVLNGTNTYPWAQLIGTEYTLTRDVYATDMSFASGARLITGGHKVYGTGKLTLDSCPANTIVPMSPARINGGNATLTVPGLGNGVVFGTIAGSLVSGSGGIGATSGAGSDPTSGSMGYAQPGNGGSINQSTDAGKGGNGSATNGSVRNFVGPASPYTPVRTAFQPLFHGVDLIRGGSQGYNGGYGGNDGTNRGGNGGSGGSGGGVIGIFFYEISTNGSTAARCINAPGGNGGNGFCSSATANVGGGGAGSGAGGGYVHIVYAVRTGVAVASLIGANGGTGGTGAANTLNSARNGRGGDGGYGGNIVAINVFDQTVATSAASGTPPTQSGTAGAAGATVSLTL